MKNNFMKAAIITGAVALAAAGGVSAYLTDYDKATNEFTVGKVEIDLDEPGWDPGDNKKIEPGKVVKKNPQITNTGINDAFVYMEVSIPVADVEAAAEDGTRLGKKSQELFSFTASNQWSKLDSFQKNGNQVYVYTYNQILKAGETTKPLFEEMKFLNVIEGQLDEKQLNVPIRTYAIQASYTGGDSDNVLTRATTAYQKYLNQNKGQEGQVTAK